MLKAGCSFLLFLLSFFSFCAYPQATCDAEIAEYKTIITVKNGKLFSDNTRELIINNRAGERYTKVEIPWSSQKKITRIEAYIKDVNGKIVKKLQKDDIIKRSMISDGSLYEDSYISEFNLRHNQYPYTVYVNYQTQEDEFFQITRWIPVYAIDIPTRKATLTINASSDSRIKFIYDHIDSFTADSTVSGISYNWNAKYSDLIKQETFSPSVSEYLPSVVAVTENFDYDRPGSFRSWTDYGNWQYSLLENIMDLSPQEKNSILNLVEGENDARKKVMILYRYLQENTRYINITIETGGLKPYPASYVALNKYGDCKALTNYLRAMLDVAGIKSFYSNVSAGDPKKSINKEFPSQQFNHAILSVPIGNDTIWLDCTSKLPFGHLSTFIQGRDAFIIDKDNSHFAKIPGLSYNNVLETRKVIIRQGLLEPASATFTNSYSGEEFEKLQYISQSVNESDKIRLVKEYYVENGFDLNDMKISSQNTPSPWMSLTYKAKSANIYRAYNDVTLITVIPFDITLPEDPKKRILPAMINYPVFKCDTLIYQIPMDFVPDTSLLNKTIASEFGEYNIETKVTGNNIEVIKSFKLKDGLIEKKKYGEFYSFISTVKNLETNNKILTRKKT